MGDRKLTVADYPLAEKRPELIEGRHGKKLADISLDALVAGDVTLGDLRITPAALRLQAEISRSAGRPMLAENFERAAELVDIPQDFVMQVYELLRPGRAKDKARLLEAARTLRETYEAERMARFVEEAAEVYERRGLFTYRF
jgi:propanediol dehydratase small subunit